MIKLTIEEYKNKYFTGNKIVLSINSFDNKELYYHETENILNLINEIDKLTSSKIFKTIEDKNDLALESYYSSVIEGAFLTRKIAKSIIRGKMKPSNKSEYMIYNNHRALEYGLDNLDELYSHKFIYDLHHILGENCLDSEEYEYRTEKVYVCDSKGEIIHTGLEPLKIYDFMSKLIDFMENSKVSNLIKSAIIHFYFVYVHPFSDGNGRTSRALSYLYLIDKGYDTFKEFSISYMISKNRTKYYKAILDVENKGNNLTVFIEFMLKSIIQSINEMRNMHDRKSLESILKEELFENDITLSATEEHILKYICSKDNYSMTLENYIKKNKSRYLKAGIKEIELVDQLMEVFNNLEEIEILSKEKNIYKVNDKYLKMLDID
ncbi:Fic family protein [Clostridioides difficile]|uniref:Fic family protein n=1 Tax=Clostridioides difficile TaxID=1496 RepID=UPI0009800B7B|nr:mobile mystery protein B [Clostridioides difficile]